MVLLFWSYVGLRGEQREPRELRNFLYFRSQVAFCSALLRDLEAVDLMVISENKPLLTCARVNGGLRGEAPGGYCDAP